VFAGLAPLLDNYGYLAVAGLLFAENLGAPVVPGETVLIAGAIYAGTGRLNVVALGVIAVAACVAGACGGWAIGWFGGRALAERYGRYVFLTPARLDRAEHFFGSRGALVFTFARFLDGLRQANGIIAGLTEMRWPRFLIFNGVGAVLWVAVWISAGYLAGDHITAIYQDMSKYLLYVLIALALAIAALILRHILHRRRTAASTTASGQEQRPNAQSADHGASEAIVDRKAE
jgi:membrane protein DedA with SNARE-associated domain